ncbi:MAG: LamB/YcsF family protein [Nitrospinota bacterium]
MATVIDINCDMGESFGIFKIGRDEEVMGYITSANVGCGFHAGDPHVMRKTVALAKEHGVAVGAHPGFPDLLSFGRREIKVTPQEMKDYILYQVGALKAFVEAAGLRLQHVKPHGSLYMMALRERDLARAVVEAIKEVSPELFLLTMWGTEQYRAAQELGLPVAGELYADLDYAPDGTQIIKRRHEAIDPEEVTRKVIRMVKEGKVRASHGKDIEVRGSTLCVHGDNPAAIEILKALREAFDREGIRVAPLREHPSPS